MPRFLTPARMCLLVLVRAYQAGQVSQESTLPALEFLARQITPSPSPEHDYDAVSDRNAIISSDISFLADALRPWTSRRPGRSVYDVVLHLVWRLDGLDSLHNLVDEQDPDLTSIGLRSLTASSPMGQFIRRCWVEFTRLQFDDAHALWNAFDAYRAPSYDEWASKNPESADERQAAMSSGEFSVLMPAKSAAITDSDSLSASVLDADTLLGFAIHHLQKMGTRVPEDVKSRLSQWIDNQWDSGTQSLHFFMAFFEHWRSGQYSMALESLHRYFDYSLAARSGSDNMKIYYQYALLHLSVLHADFECWEDSIDAMNECIATARENQDTACLNFALSWLLYLRHAHPDRGKSSFGAVSGVVGSGGGEHDEIAFLKQKAREGKHWMLLSSTLLEEAKLEMYNGGNVNRAHEHVLQSMYLSIQHDLRTLMPAATLFQGASLDRIGQAHIADCYYELANAIHVPHCPQNDRVRATCRMAYKLAQDGSFSRSLEVLQSLAPDLRGVLKLEQRLKAFAALIQLRRRLHRGNLDDAGYYLNQLKPLRSGSDPEIVFEINVLEIEYLIRRKQFEAALQKVSERLKEVKGRGSDLAQRLHFLILKSRIFAAGGQASKGFTIALRATSTAERHLLIPVMLEGLTVLARILVELSEFEAARDVLETTLPHAIEFSHVGLTARMYVAIGEACVGFAGHGCDPGSSEQAHSMRKAQGYIEQGRAAYERAEDLNGMLDCLVMKSKLANWSGDETSASQCDKKYLQLLADQ